MKWLCALLALPLAIHAANPDSWANDLSPISQADWTYARAAHLLERAGFGGTPEEVERLARMSPAEAVASLVDYEKVTEGPIPEFVPSGIYPHGYKLAPLDAVGREMFLTGHAFGIPAAQEGKLPLQPAINEFYTLLISEHAEMRRAVEWWAQRMLLTPRPLEEKLTLFWHNHFATSQEKVTNHELMLRQIAMLRAHANGNFGELLIAIAQDPAMLIWLDNRENRKGKPNENFAREILELFCMGAGQGYTEKDIRELARAFTGWTFRAQVRTNDEPRFFADAETHDGGVKTFLGATGDFEGTNAIRLILGQPAAPRFITRKLYRAFVREEISPGVNQELANLLSSSNYELRPLLKRIFLSRDFYSESSVGTQIKAPVPFLISTYRKLGLKELPGTPSFSETAGPGPGPVLSAKRSRLAGWQIVDQPGYPAGTRQFRTRPSFSRKRPRCCPG
jgi:hypothetical protein